MAILIDENTKFLIQGITGNQGQRTCEEMLKAGSKVVCGVTPNKSGQKCCNVPVYNSIKEAQGKHQIDATIILVPPRFAKGAILEAINAKIPLVNIITENIPVHDMAQCLALARKNNIRIIGAASVGIYSVGKSKCGLIASGKSKIAFTPGSIGVISRSGGMSCETSLVLTQEGLGQSTVISTGSDVLMGDCFLELVREFENDSETEGIVLFGEVGGTAEEDLANYLIERKSQGNPYLKPIAAFISGKFAEENNLQNVSLGHAGAIIEGEKGTRKNKVQKLKEAGVIIAEVHHNVGKLIKEALENSKGASEGVSKVVSKWVLETELKQELKQELETKNRPLEWKTKISKIEPNDVIIRGEKLSQLIRNHSFSDSIFLLLSGRKPEEKEGIIFEKLLVSIIDHGMGTTSSLTSRFAISGGNALNVGVAAGVLSIGDYHGGAIEKSMQQLMNWKLLEGDESAKEIIDAISNQKTIYGFGHKHYKEGDPRVKVILEEIEKIGYVSNHLFLTKLVEESFQEIKSKKILLNIDGLIAALLCDFGFDSDLGKGIFILGRTPGLIAQCHEEKKFEKPVRRLREEDINYYP